MKNKGKSKSKSHKASLQKLANKKTNRLAKQGKLHKGDKKKKKKRAQQEEINQKQQSQISNSVVEDEDTNASDSSLDEKDTEYFQHLNNAKEFARINLDPSSAADGNERGKKRKRAEVEEVQDYELQPRSFSENSDLKNMKMMLPIISKGKVIKRMMLDEEKTKKAEEENLNESDLAMDNTDDKENGDAQVEGEKDERAHFESLTTAQQFVYRRNKLAEKKQRIANLSHDILEDPQNNMKKLKELRFLLGETAPGVSLTVRKYAMVSLMEVFKDIVPGYRLRIPTDKERAQRVKKETKSLWDYEASFLLNYKVYLQYLETVAKGKPIPDKSFLTKHGITQLQLPKSSIKEMSKLALKCLCQMLVNQPHFNYTSDIINTVVHFTNHGDEELSQIACDAVRSMFKQDKVGSITLEIVRNIGRMAKKLQFDIQPQVLLTFLDLKIKEVDLSGLNEKPEKMKRKEKMMKFSRRERKHLKQKEQLDRELLETKATADKNQRIKLHTEVIQAVFETYIRVIKQASDSIVLPAVLEGLAKFAHLINIEYFDSLFAALNSLIESQILSPKEILYCIQTAFVVLSGQGSVINIDPSGFYKHFYGILLSISAGSNSSSVPIALECLDSLINKRRKQVSQQRILAFIKRLSTMCLQQTPEAALGFLAAIRQFVHTYKYSDMLFDEDIQGSGVYLPYLEDPEHCCANSTSLWELHLLKHHYDPHVQTYTKHVIRQAPLAGEHQLPKTLARKSPKDVYDILSDRGLFDDIPEKTSRKKRLRTAFCNQEFQDQVTSILDSVPGFSKDDQRTHEVDMDTS